jgi:hypothetical protein
MLLTALACALGGASLALAGASGWRVERVGRVPSPSYYGGNLALTGNARGRRVIAWIGPGGLRVAVARPGRAFGPGRRVPHQGRGATAPRLAMNSRGQTLVLWHYFDETHFEIPNARDEDCCFGVRLAVLRRDGRFGRVATLTPPAIDVDVGGYAIDRRGRYGVVWTESDYRYDDRGPARPGLLGRLSRGRGLGDVRKIDSGGEGRLLAFVDGRPSVLLSVAGERGTRLLERRAHRNGRFGARRTLARGLPHEPSIAAAANERGDEVVAWTRYFDEPGQRMHAGTRTAGERLRTRVVARTQTDEPQTVAIAPSGAAAVAWTRERPGMLLATSKGPGRPFRDASFVVGPRGNRDETSSPQLAVDAAGRVAIAWLSYDSPEGDRVHAALVDGSGRLLRHNRFRGYNADLGLQLPAAFDERGRATLAWKRGAYVRAATARIDR